MHVKITDDIDLNKICDSGQCFRVKELRPGLFRFISGDRLLYLRRIEEHIEENEFEADTDEELWVSFWRIYFDLDRNYAGVRAAVPPDDLYLTEAVEFGRGIRILRQDPWEMLITFILSQRKNIPAIRSAVETLCSRYGRPVASSYETVYSFPSPKALSVLSEDELRGCGLGYRAPYVADAARRVTEGSLNLDRLGLLPDRELLETLQSVRGVGLKVANCVCLFAYGRTGMAPVDTWIQRVIAEKYSGVSPFPGYGGNAGIMQQYMFYHALRHKGD